MSIMSTAGSGYFSSDRTIRQYAEVRRKQISDELVPSDLLSGSGLARNMCWCAHAQAWPPVLTACVARLQEIWQAKPCPVPSNL